MTPILSIILIGLLAAAAIAGILWWLNRPTPKPEAEPEANINDLNDLNDLNEPGDKPLFAPEPEPEPKPEAKPAAAPLAQMLGLDPQATIEQIQEKITNLQGEISDLRTENYTLRNQPTAAEQTEACLRTIWQTVADKSKKLADKASEGKHSTEDSLRTALQILLADYTRPKTDEATATPSLEITQAHLDRIENRYTLKCFVIDQLTAAGIKGLSKNAELATQLQSLAEAAATRTPDAEIVAEAIKADTLSPDDRQILLSRLITAINNAVADPAIAIDADTQEADLISHIARKIKLPDSLEQVGEELSTLRDKSTKTDEILRQYNADSISALPEAIRQELFDSIQSTAKSKIDILLTDHTPTSTQQLVNDLIATAEDAIEANRLITGELTAKVKTLQPQDEPLATGALDLIVQYTTLTDNERTLLQADITDKTAQIDTLVAKTAAQEAEIATLTDTRSQLMAPAGHLAEALRSGAKTVIDSIRPILRPCTDDFDTQADDIEYRLSEALTQAMEPLTQYEPGPDNTPADTRTDIQNRLCALLDASDSPVNTLCRYTAYSRLPFMTDTHRQYGLTFRRANTSRLYSAIQALYGRFGILLTLPTLFVEGFDEGTYDSLNGQAYNELDCLCPNSTNHAQRIDTDTPPARLIVDLVTPGYSVDSQTRRLPGVLTL